MWMSNYDFGDNWEHTVLVEKILPVEKGKRYPNCSKGKSHMLNACRTKLTI